MTRIALDHTALLGPTLGSIAAEKAGIFKAGTAVVISRQSTGAMGVLTGAARALGVEPRVAGEHFALEGEGLHRFVSGSFQVAGLRLSLAGAHQRENAESAVECARLFRPGLGAEPIRAGLAQTVWPGRLETVAEDPTVVLDGAHNPDGARALAEAVKALYPGRPLQLVLGALADKDVEGIAAPLVPLARGIHLASPDNDRALPAASLAAIVARLGVEAGVYGSVRDALAAACRAALLDGPTGLVLAAGSLFVVGEVRAEMVGASAEPDDP